MKKIIAIVVLAAFPVILSAQDFVDNLINKYQGKSGFTTVVINSAQGTVDSKHCSGIFVDSDGRLW